MEDLQHSSLMDDALGASASTRTAAYAVHGHGGNIADDHGIAAVRVGTLMTRSITESDLEVMAARHFRVLDTDGNGSLDILEFVAGMGTLFKGSVAQQWKYAFDLFDADNDGFVTHQDLAEMF